MSAMFVYVTAEDAETARRIGRAVVEARLAACANVLDGMDSIYWWEGTVQEAREAVLILKTTAERFDALAARVRALHPYDLPCIVALPVVAGHAPYLDWIARETQASPAADPAPLPGDG